MKVQLCKKQFCLNDVLIYIYVPFKLLFHVTPSLLWPTSTDVLNVYLYCPLVKFRKWFYFFLVQGTESYAKACVTKM